MRNVSGDQFAFPCAQWRVASQNYLDVLEQRARGSWERLKDVQKRCFGRQRSEKRHCSMFAGFCRTSISADAPLPDMCWLFESCVKSLP